MRSPDALRPLTLCNCDCKIITMATCFGRHRYSIRCIHPAQRCVSTRQMTDNIFEVETTALAHFACVTRDSGILLNDFACACPSVNHSWIFHLLEKAELPRFIQQFLRMIYNNSVTDVVFAGKTEERCQTRLSCKCLFVCDGVRPYLSMASRLVYFQEPC